MKSVLRHGTFPLFFVGFNGAALALIAAGAGDAARYALLLAALATMLVIERAIPWQPEWNRSHGDVASDLAHGIVNTLLTYALVSALPRLTALLPWPALWPAHWPLAVQVLAAVLVLDLGVAAVHHASHRSGWLWRFHAIHHGATRLYGFNGWMKHPAHQLLETGVGMTPLLLLGVTQPVGQAVAFAVAIQLLLQHSNADLRTGPLRRVFATAEVHRFHHARGPAGDVNFGLFTTLWDHLAGSFHDERGAAPRAPGSVGLEGASEPRRYRRELAKPFG